MRLATLSTPDLIAALLLAATLVASSHPVTGDGAEYVVMAQQLSHFHAPSVTLDDARRAGVLDDRLINRHGRQEMWHFWLLPLLAAPVMAAVTAAGGPPALAFGIVNAILLWIAFAVLRRRAGLIGAVLFCLSPIVWWIDKPQVEVFTFVWILLGCLALPRLAVAALCFAIAATQNPPIAILVVLVWLFGLAPLPRRRLDRWLLLLAIAVIGLHPLYYSLQLSRATPLVDSNDLRLPGLQAFITPLLDINVGLLTNAPLVVAIIGMVIVMSWRRHGPSRRLAFVLGAQAFFLFAFAQAPNANSGGTPGVSRYALWLLPLVVLLIDGDGGGNAKGRVRPALTLLTLLSGLWSCAFFNPLRPERYLAPTPLAALVWSRYPRLENPLPEIFAERLRHQDGVNLIAATGNCAKALIQEGRWPDPCTSSQPVPAICQEDGALCYANQRADGSYAFVPTSRRGGIRLADLWRAAAR